MGTGARLLGYLLVGSALVQQAQASLATVKSGLSALYVATGGADGNWEESENWYAP